MEKNHTKHRIKKQDFMKSILFLSTLVISFFATSQLRITMSIIDKTTDEKISYAVVAVGQDQYGYSSYNGEISLPANVFLDDTLFVSHPNFHFEKRVLSSYNGTIDANGDVHYKVYGYPSSTKVNIDLALATTNKVANDSIELHVFDFNPEGKLLLINNHQPKTKRFFQHQDFEHSILISANDLHDGYFIKYNGTHTDTIPFDRTKWNNTIIFNKNVLNPMNANQNISNYIYFQNKQVKRFWKERNELNNTIDSLANELIKCQGKDVAPLAPEPIAEAPVYLLYNSEITPSKSAIQIKSAIETFIGREKIKKQGILQFIVTTYPDGKSSVKSIGKVSEEHQMIKSLILRELKDIKWDYTNAIKKIRHNIHYTFTIIPK